MDIFDVNFTNDAMTTHRNSRHWTWHCNHGGGKTGGLRLSVSSQIRQNDATPVRLIPQHAAKVVK